MTLIPFANKYRKGRATDADLIKELLDIQDGVTIVAGPPGVGKSRLIKTLVSDRLTQQHRQVALFGASARQYAPLTTRNVAMFDDNALAVTNIPMGPIDPQNVRAAEVACNKVVMQLIRRQDSTVCLRRPARRRRLCENRF